MEDEAFAGPSEQFEAVFTALKTLVPPDQYHSLQQKSSKLHANGAKTNEMDTGTHASLYDRHASLEIDVLASSHPYAGSQVADVVRATPYSFVTHRAAIEMLAPADVATEFRMALLLASVIDDFDPAMAKRYSWV